VAALVHHDVCIAAFDRVERRAHIAHHAVAHVPEIKVVGRARKDGRIFFRRVFRAIDVGRHPLAVAHWDHDLAIDDGDGLQFCFDRIAVLDLCGG
jgi:hypothetical protein